MAFRGRAEATRVTGTLSIGASLEKLLAAPSGRHSQPETSASLPREVPGRPMTTQPFTPSPAANISPLQGLTDSLPSDTGRTRILAVDDSPLDLQLLEDQLTSEGYLVSAARDGEEALAKVAVEPPDLILLDVVMPRLDGYEVCRRLKSDGRTILIPVVMVTSLQATHERIKGIEAGADEFLSKPFNRQELMTRVRSLLKLKRHTDELDSA
jgi:CheY-like chemotaxis protein